MARILDNIARRMTTLPHVLAVAAAGAIALLAALTSGPGVGVALAQATGKPVAPVSSSKPLKLGVTFTTRSMLGALVMDVYPGSPAATAGLRPGDRILEANGHTIQGADDAVQLVNQLGANSPLHMLIARDGQRRVVETTLKPWKSAATAAAGPVSAPGPVIYAPFPQGFPFQLTPADLDDQHAYGG